jgi:hypothetical protein
VDLKDGSELWYDDRDVAFLREDLTAAADIQAREASTITGLISSGFEPDSVVRAVRTGDFALLKHIAAGLLLSVHVAIKSETKGEEAVFARLNVIDHDNDVTVPGAFKEGQTVAISQHGHTIWDGTAPVGKGTIHTVGDTAVFRGKFFMDMQAARDTFHAVKGMAEHGQWSYGFNTLTAEPGQLGGKDGAANVMQCVKGIALLNGARNGPGFPDDVAKAVYDHLADHLKDADRNPPEFLKAAEGKFTFYEQAAVALADFDAVLDRADEIVRLRAQKTRKFDSKRAEKAAQASALPPVSTEMLDWMTDSMRRAKALIDTPAEDLMRERLRFMREQFLRDNPPAGE